MLPVSVDYLVVAGGGSGGGYFGGGGAGGYRTSFPGGTKLTLAGATSYPITVGGGGTALTPASPNSTRGNPGSDSSFSTITSAGGGGGGAQNPPPAATGLAGGSGGGGG
jgi:hypothetical protein